jgi:hypothetical protein
MIPKASPEEKEKYSWLRLLQASGKSDRGLAEPKLNSNMGRPRKSFPVVHTSVDLTAADKESIELFQKKLCKIIGRNLSKGELFGLAANIINARLNFLKLSNAEFKDIIEFANAVIGEDETGVGQEK